MNTQRIHQTDASLAEILAPRSLEDALLLLHDAIQRSVGDGRNMINCNRACGGSVPSLMRSESRQRRCWCG